MTDTVDHGSLRMLRARLVACSLEIEGYEAKIAARKEEARIILVMLRAARDSQKAVENANENANET